VIDDHLEIGLILAYLAYRVGGSLDIRALPPVTRVSPVPAAPLLPFA
jgi:hypothetical protein